MATAAATTTQRSTMERAILRARRNQVEVIGVGVSRDGRKVWAVPSTRDPQGQWYLVTLSADGRTLRCHCEAGKYNRPCIHRAAVHLRIERDRQEAREHEREYERREAEEHNRLMRTIDARLAVTSEMLDRLDEDEYYVWPTGKTPPAATRDTPRWQEDWKSYASMGGSHIERV